MIHTTLHRKKTATNSILHAQSFHPKSVIRGVPMGEFTRLKRNCSQEKYEKMETNKCVERLKRRGYKDNILRSGLQKIESKTRD